jgi:seryl-tRNA synthetase
MLSGTSYPGFMKRQPMTNHEIHKTQQEILGQLHELRKSIHVLGEKMSEELKALKAAVDANAEQLNENTAAVDLAVTTLGNVNNPSVDTAAIQSAANAISAQTEILKANNAKLNAALTPPASA